MSCADDLVEHVICTLGNQLDFSTPAQSFSPFYSDIGLGFTQEGGIAHLYLHYNRETSSLGGPFLQLPSIPERSEAAALGVRQFFELGTADYAFYARNSWIVECRNVARAEFCLGYDQRLTELRKSGVEDPEMHLYDGYLRTQDPRDPDSHFPVIIGLRVVQGKHTGGDGITSPLILGPAESNRLVMSFSVNCLETSHEGIERRLLAAPTGSEEARALSRIWLKRALGNVPCYSEQQNEARTLAEAAYTLAANSAEAPGLLAGRIASFPNRGAYPAHYLWDSCFQNLALEFMASNLAADALLLLTENLRADGKMAHFLCSTWIRPGASQPPLVGWAALRLVKQRHDISLARRFVVPIWKNTQWWLTHRMTRYGLISCLDPLETGWDNTPRLDHGPVLACDMNSYLLLQMRACAELAQMTGEDQLAADIKEQAGEYADRILEVLYDPDTNLFKDVLIANGRRLPIKTPACFLPLLATVPLGSNNARRMIEEYLLDPDLFFGPIPFPSVAYNEVTYNPGDWWRGPTWLAVAYLMLEVLKMHGYQREYREAAGRLYTTILKDGDLHEAFNSQTGSGIGCVQQGWTAAILLRLKLELHSAPRPT